MNYIVPCFIILIVSYSMLNKQPVYRDFCTGAKNGLSTLVNIFPALLSVSVAFSVFRESGLMGELLRCIYPVIEKLGVSEDVLSLIMVRPLSGSGALGVLETVFKNNGADSFSGRFASVITGSTETTFYALTVYFSNTKVKKYAKVIPAAIFGDVIGIIIGYIVCRFFF